MARSEGESTRTNISLSLNGAELIGQCSSALDGNFFDFRNDVAAVFDTPQGPLLVDFSKYDEEYPQTKGPMGAVVIEGEFLSSNGNSARRTNSSTLKGERLIHTGNRGKGSQSISLNKNVAVELLVPAWKIELLHKGIKV